MKNANEAAQTAKRMVLTFNPKMLPVGRDTATNSKTSSDVAAIGRCRNGGSTINSYREPIYFTRFDLRLILRQRCCKSLSFQHIRTCVRSFRAHQFRLLPSRTVPEFVTAIATFAVARLGCGRAIRRNWWRGVQQYLRPIYSFSQLWLNCGCRIV